MKTQQIMLVSVVTSFIVVAVVMAVYAILIPQKGQLSNEELIADYYYTENAVSVSPHGLRKKMDKGDTSFILVDLRSQEEYNREHIVGAVSIPAYATPDQSAYGDVDRIVNEFKALPEGKEIITYCYSTACMTSRKIGKILAEHGIYVKHLNIGWNEWRYFWDSWNHEHELDITDVEDYIYKGSEPGTPLLKLESLDEGCAVNDLIGC